MSVQRLTALLVTLTTVRSTVATLPSELGPNVPRVAVEATSSAPGLAPVPNRNMAVQTVTTLGQQRNGESVRHKLAHGIRHTENGQPVQRPVQEVSKKEQEIATHLIAKSDESIALTWVVASKPDHAKHSRVRLMEIGEHGHHGALVLRHVVLVAEQRHGSATTLQLNTEVWDVQATTMSKNIAISSHVQSTVTGLGGLTGELVLSYAVEDNKRGSETVATRNPNTKARIVQEKAAKSKPVTVTTVPLTVAGPNGVCGGNAQSLAVVAARTVFDAAPHLYQNTVENDAQVPLFKQSNVEPNTVQYQDNGVRSHPTVNAANLAEEESN